MNSKFLEKGSRIIIGVLILIAIGIMIIPKNEKIKEQEKDTVPKPEQKITTQTINVTASGFEPKTITIPKDTVIVWMNKTRKKVSVNSDDYPTNKKYPFLNLGSFAPETTVQVQFVNTGTFTYHNYLVPTQKGTVIVK